MDGHETEIIPNIAELLEGLPSRKGLYGRAEVLVPMLKRFTDDQLAQAKDVRVFAAIVILSKAKEDRELQRYAAAVAQGSLLDYHNVKKQINVYVDSGLEKCIKGKQTPQDFFQRIADGAARINGRE